MIEPQAFKKSDLCYSISCAAVHGENGISMNLAENALLSGSRFWCSVWRCLQTRYIDVVVSIGRIDQTKVRSGKLEEEDWPRLTSAVSMLMDQPLYIDDAPSSAPLRYRSRARRIARENNGEAF